jgi:hypothetical protein
MEGGKRDTNDEATMELGIGWDQNIVDLGGRCRLKLSAKAMQKPRDAVYAFSTTSSLALPIRRGQHFRQLQDIRN